MTSEETKALAFLRAAIVEDGDVLKYLMQSEVTVDTFAELLRIAAGAMELFAGRDRATQFVEGWLKLSNENANT